LEFPFSRFVCFGVVALLILSGPSSAAEDHDGLKEEIDRLKQENAELRKHLESEGQSSIR